MYELSKFSSPVPENATSPHRFHTPALPEQQHTLATAMQHEKSSKVLKYSGGVGVVGLAEVGDGLDGRIDCGPLSRKARTNSPAKIYQSNQKPQPRHGKPFTQKNQRNFETVGPTVGC